MRSSDLSVPLAKRKKPAVPPPPVRNFFALIITKCGSICLCTCDGCQQHWKAVIGGEGGESFLMFPGVEFSGAFQMLVFGLLLFCFACNSPFPLN